MFQEYSDLLQDQLETQRAYYEGEITRVTEDSCDRISELEKQMCSLQSKVQELETENNRLGQKAVDLEKEVATQRRKALAMEKLNKTLVDRQNKKMASHVNKTNELKDVITRLKAENRDLMAHLEMSTSLDQRSDHDEIKDGLMMIGRSKKR
ncbi:hypothetical protein GEMRC1_011821 [Eukaryota sp. GEM-RC1]